MGEANKRTLELVQNWCAHLVIEKQGGGGLVEQFTNLPIGPRSLACPHAAAPGFSGHDLKFLAIDFHDRNCAGCAHRKPVGFPNLSSLIDERDKARDAAAAEAARREATAAAALQQRDAKQQTIRADLTPPSANVIDQIEDVDHGREGANADRLVGPIRSTICAARNRRIGAFKLRFPCRDEIHELSASRFNGAPRLGSRTQKGYAAAAKAIERLTTPYKEGYVPPSVLNWNDADDNNAFHSKLMVMDFDGTISTEVAVFKKKELYDDIVTMGLPLSNDGKQLPAQIITVGGCIPKGAKNIAMAKDFLKYAAQPKVLNTWLKNGLGRFMLPVPEIVQSDPFWLKDDPHRKAYTEEPRKLPSVPAPTAAELSSLVLTAPIMARAEYLTQDVLLALWDEMERAFAASLAAAKVGLFQPRRRMRWRRFSRRSDRGAKVVPNRPIASRGRDHGANGRTHKGKRT